MANAFSDVVLRPPVQQALRAFDTGIGAHDVTRPPSGFTRLDRALGHAVERVEKFPDGGTCPGAQVDDGRRTGQDVELPERRHMRRGQVPDMDIVPDARSIPGRVVGSGDQERNAMLLCLDHLAQGVGRPRQLQAGAHLGIRAYGIEVPQ